MTAEEARDALRSWGRRRQSLERDRDPLVTRALAAGLSKEEVHILTGLGRTTIDRIAARNTAK
jgi:DNA invertase Pin-like site-specific DNA recombinase